MTSVKQRPAREQDHRRLLPRRLVLPNGREVPLGDWPREIPCAGCGADLGRFTTVRLTPDYRRVCPACWVAERCGAGIGDTTEGS